VKNLLLSLLLVVSVAGAAGVVAFRTTGDPAVEQALSDKNALEWLRADFDLNDKQFAAIKQLHESYASVCDEHCREIRAATRQLETLKASGNPDQAAIAAAERQLQQVRFTCETAIAAHVRRCAAEMNPDARQRYLALMLPKISSYDHASAPDLGMNSHSHRH
jgi:uncharacterized membrane protein